MAEVSDLQNSKYKNYPSTLLLHIPLLYTPLHHSTSLYITLLHPPLWNSPLFNILLLKLLLGELLSHLPSEFPFKLWLSCDDLIIKIRPILLWILKYKFLFATPPKDSDNFNWHSQIINHKIFESNRDRSPGYWFQLFLSGWGWPQVQKAEKTWKQKKHCTKKQCSKRNNKQSYKTTKRENHWRNNHGGAHAVVVAVEGASTVSGWWRNQHDDP